MATTKIKIGETYGRLTVLGLDRSFWGLMAVCRCECGRTTQTRARGILSGHARSCGCMFRGNKKHGHATGRWSPEYSSWVNMIGRCTLKSHINYKSYGGRGIRVCDRWAKSFNAFLLDVGSKPASHYTLGRIDNDGDYEPRNVRWETPEQQRFNKQNTVFLTFNGERKNLNEWSKAVGLSARLIRERVYHGWPAGRALTTPSKRKAI